MNHVLTATAPASKEPDYKVIRQELINSMGIDAYLDSYIRYLKSQALNDAERFDMYYQSRSEIKTNQ